MRNSFKNYHLLVFAFSLLFFISCSSEEMSSDDDITGEEIVDENEDPDMEEDMGDDNSDGNDNNTGGGDDDTSSLSERFVFEGNIVIENSWDTEGCDSPPCDTNDESLDDFFETGQPDDPYFYLADDESELFLECQFEKGRRIEFKQKSNGPLTSLSRMEFEGVYYDIPEGGMTIAQVHNRGGTGNKPFFRLELHEDRLETVIRKDPEVSSGETTFEKEDFPFVDGANYDQSALKVLLEKSEGLVHISAEYNGVVILDESYAPDSSTRWVTDSGIANGFYMKAGLYNAAVAYTKNLVLGYTTFKFQTDDQ